MTGRNKTIYMLILSWAALAALFIVWGLTSLTILIDIPNWATEPPLEFKNTFDRIIPILHYGYLTSTIMGIVFSSVFTIIAYGIYKKDQWVWSTGLIFSTIFLTIFGFLLASFMINLVIFKDDFSIFGITIILIAFLTDLGVVFLHTRPDTKLYFNLKK